MCKLKLVNNSSKTDLIVFCNRNSNIPSTDSSSLLGTELPLRSSINLLGFSLDCKLTFMNQVNRVCRQCYIQLRKFYSIRKFLGEKQRKELVSCFVLSSLDYCNVVYHRFKVDRSMAPIYIENFFQRNTTSARPSHQKLFRIPRCSSDAMRKSFNFQGAKRWNELLDYIRNAKTFEEFKNLLKTHLFCQAF